MTDSIDNAPQDNVAEFYVIFSVLIRLGVVPVNAVFSYNENELITYVKQIEPKLLIVSVVLFFASPMSNHITMQDVVADGGVTLNA